MRVAIIGLGSRGRNYGGHLHRSGVEIVAVCDKYQNKLDISGARWGVPAENRFTDENRFFALGKVADLMVIATQDRDHFGHAMRAMELGYDLLLEKPLSPSYDECLEMERYAREHGRKVLVCHVLRYAPYYRRIRETIEQGLLGEIKEIRHSENVSYWHFAHSYVRGNWRSESETSPFLLAKCCHDMDLMTWFAGSRCKSLSSYGDLSYFTAANAPDGAADNCFDCKYSGECTYDAAYQYVGRNGKRKKFPWGTYAFCQSRKKADILDSLKNGEKGKLYSRCVYKCDNDVTDCQTVNMLFENGVKCSFTASAFNEKNHRHTEIRGTKGELVADDEKSVLWFKPFDGKVKRIKVNFLTLLKGHYGGDEGIVKAVLALPNTEVGDSQYTWIADTLESHRIVAAAELSRHEGGRQVILDEAFQKGGK